MNKFPERVWTATGIDDHGRTMWSSRYAEAEDWDRRNAFMDAFDERQAAIFDPAPDRVLRRAG